MLRCVNGRGVSGTDCCSVLSHRVLEIKMCCWCVSFSVPSSNKSA